MKFWEGSLSRGYRTLAGEKIVDLSELVGSKITSVGFHPSAEEGGLSFDYEIGERKKRIVLGFNELGIWKIWQGEVNSPSMVDKLKEKIIEFVDSDDFWSDFIIVDKSSERRYVFLSDGKEIFSLEVNEVKLLPENLRASLFENERNMDEIYHLFGLAAFNPGW